MTDCTKQTTQIMKYKNEYDHLKKKISASGLLNKKKTQKNDKNIRYNS